MASSRSAIAPDDAGRRRLLISALEAAEGFDEARRVREGLAAPDETARDRATGDAG